MGAGCYYTHKCNGEKAYWVDIDTIISEDEVYAYQDLLENIRYCMEALGYIHISDTEYHNGLVKVLFESTYYGDGIVIIIEPLADGNYYDCNLYNLAIANHAKMERRIAKKLNENFPLRYATSGYTSQGINVGELV